MFMRETLPALTFYYLWAVEKYYKEANLMMNVKVQLKTNINNISKYNILFSDYLKTIIF